MKSNLLLDVLIALFVLLFVYTASAKLMNFGDHVKAMHNQPLAGWLINILIYAIPIIEILVVALLLRETTKLVGLYIFTTSMIFFTGYVALVLSNHYARIPCSCVGLMKQLNWHAHLSINIVFTCMGLITIYMTRKRRPRDVIQIKQPIYDLSR